MSVQRLRDAATAERKEWEGDRCVKPYAHAAALHLALADWLDDMADHNASESMPMERGAYVVADIILGFTCDGCGREELTCSKNPCQRVIADREA